MPKTLKDFVNLTPIQEKILNLVNKEEIFLNIFTSNV